MPRRIAASPVSARGSAAADVIPKPAGDGAGIAAILADRQGDSFSRSLWACATVMLRTLAIREMTASAP